MKYCVPLILFILLLFAFQPSTYAQTAPNARTNADEVCNNGIDDDGDGDIDCADGDCVFECAGKEICNNGKDDDGDGLIDCFDSDCGNSIYCETDCGNGIDDDGDGFYDSYDGDCLVNPDDINEYIILRPDCEAKPIRQDFNLEEAWTSDVGTSTAYGLPAIADIDDDGFPEVVVLNQQKKKLTILDGRSGVIEREKILPFEPALYPTVADVDGDGKGEIFIMSDDGRIRAYKDDLSEIAAWGGEKRVTNLSKNRITNIADFNEDGVAELYYVNEIINATNGALIVKGSHNSNPKMYPSANNWNEELNGISVAVDILDDSECSDCDGLELVVGHIIYSVDIGAKKLTERRNMNDPAVAKEGYYNGKNFVTKYTSFGNQVYSSTSIVDYNTDGYLDVLLGGTVGHHINGPSMVFFWDVKNQVAKSFVATRPYSTIPGSVVGNFRDINGGSCDPGEDCTWLRGIGAINVANIDADPELECTFMTGLSLYALDNELDLEWVNHTSFWEVSSGFTGTSVFDFDGDGQSEIIYRDEIDLYIIKGKDGSISNQVSGSPCSSQTQAEYPIVADVDGDGETEIIVTCGDVPNTYGQNPATDTRRDRGVVRVYKSKDSFWVPARKLWNQFSYFNVNINDNLSIPRVMQPHNVNFAQVCANSNGPKFSLNKFLNQSPRITNCGDLAFPAAQLDLNKDSISVVPPSCPAEQLTVNLYFENNGDYPVTKPIPVAFYSKNPTTYEGTDDIFLDTVYVDVPLGLQPDSSYRTTFTIDAKVGASNIYVSLNDIGPFDKKTKARIPPGDFYKLDSLNGTVNECVTTPTVVATLVAPEGFPVNIKKLNDNRSCLSTIKNGELQALDKDSLQFDPLGEYTFTWTNIKTGQQIATGSSDILTNLDSGEYQVEVQYNNGSFTCVGGRDTTKIELIEAFPPNLRVSVKEVSAVSSCKEGTADGIAQVYIRNLDNPPTVDSIPDTNDYTIVFSKEENAGSSEDVQAPGGRAENLKAQGYNIFIIDNATGCPAPKTAFDMSLAKPKLDDPDVEPVTFCDNPNGKITINLDPSSVDPKATYKYMLINTAVSGDTLRQDSPVFEDLSAGTYRIGAYNVDNECGLFDFSNYKEVEVEDKTVEPDVTLSVAQEQTACEVPFNGQLTATPAAGSPSYEYTWYQGTDTNPTTGIVVAQTATTPDTLGTSITDTYTLVAKDPTTGCVTSETIRLIENITRPVIDPANIEVKPLTQCGSTNGQITITMGNATDGYTTDGYTFRLYEGTNTTGSFVEESDGIFTGLDSIKYTLVVKDEKTRCLTDDTQGYEIKVPSNIVYPETVLVLSPVDQNSCDSNNPNGSISASIAGGNVSDYTFRWFKNDGNGVKAKLTSAEPQAIYNSDSSQVRGLTTGSYILEITTDSTGCTSSKTIFLEDDEVSGDDIQLDLVSTDATSCDNPNGSLTVDKVRITTDGGTSFTDDDISQYDFRWYEGNDDTTPIDENTNPSAVTSSLTGVLPGEYTVVATNRISTCLSSFYTGTVDGPPALTFDFQAQQQGSTGSLDPCTNPDGGLSIINLAGGSGNYTYQWYQGSDTSVPIPGATTPSLSSIRSDKYTVEITDVSTGCATDSTFLLESIPGLTPVPPAVLTITSPATTCDPDNYDGELVAEVDPSVRSASYPSHTNDDFFYYWFEGDQVKYKSPLPNPGNLDDPANYDTFRNPPIPSDNKAALTQLAPGEYTVVIIDAKDYIAAGANDISLLGCRSAPNTFEVEEIAQAPEKVDLTVTNNTACSPNGSITLRVGKKGTDNTAYNGYTFLWSRDGIAVPASQVVTNDNNATEESTSTASNLEGGQYTVIIQDGTTICDTTIFVQVINDYVIEEIATVTPTHSKVCAGTGSLEVTAMSNSAPISDYTFVWFNENFDETKAANDPANAGAIVTDATPNNEDLLNQPVGTYWVAAMHNVTQCYSIAVKQTIKDQAPVIEIRPGPDKKSFISCTGVNEGLLDIDVQSSDGVARNYGYSWTDLAGNAIPIANGGNTDEITNLQDGKYIVTVTESTGDLCQVIDTFAVDLINKLPILDASGTDITICASGGSITVDEVRLNGIAETDLTRYDYTWYQGSFDATGKTAFDDAVAAGDYTYDATTFTYSGLAEGVYYLQAAANFPDGCTSQQVQVTIEDKVPVFNIVNTFISPPITACDPSLYTKGEIEIRIDGLTNYNIQWYQGDDTSNPIDLLTNASADDLLLKDVPPGTYTVRVTDGNFPSIQCPQTRTYEIKENKVPLSVNLSANPQTSCIEGKENGAVSAVPTGGASGATYQYTWYKGDGTTILTDAEYPSLASNPALLEGVPAGDYIVEVNTIVDADNPDICAAARDTITVEDRSDNDLQITVNPDYPVSNCDETNPNGQLTAQFEGSLSRYAFYWYEGTDITANPVAEGATAFDLAENTYSVIALDRITGCLSDPFTGDVVTMLDTALFPAPTVEIISPVTRCLDPNGAARATLDSAMLDPNVAYEYIWYDSEGQEIFVSRRTNEIYQLDTGLYTVLAKNLSTGCLTEPASVIIGENIDVPDFEIVTTPSVCEQATGSVAIQLNEPIKIVKVEWETPLGYNEGPFLTNQPAGEYQATITDENGCQTTQSAVILPDIEVFNAVSSNGDGKNDIFHINCIGAFENNIVRIYNRAGSLVYEHVGYDNERVFFEGYGNKGLYFGAKELPDGTYFYIVDKRNGDDPVSGYLELLR